MKIRESLLNLHSHLSAGCNKSMHSQDISHPLDGVTKLWRPATCEVCDLCCCKDFPARPLQMTSSLSFSHWLLPRFTLVLTFVVNTLSFLRAIYTEYSQIWLSAEGHQGRSHHRIHSRHFRHSWPCLESNTEGWIYGWWKVGRAIKNSKVYK